MILADKIMNERKKRGWSQEELANQLSVSRQSVSKWEGAQSVPDLQKIIMMAEIFGVSTDYLLKDEMEEPIVATKETVLLKEESVSEPPAKTVSLEEASEYINLSLSRAPKAAFAVMMWVMSPVLLIILAGISDDSRYNLSGNMAAAMGLSVLFLFVIGALIIYMGADKSLKKFNYIKEEKIDTAYGVIGLVEEKKKKAESRHMMNNIVATIMCVGSPVPLVITSLLGASDTVIVFMVGLLLMIVAVAVNIFVRESIEWNCYTSLLQEKLFPYFIHRLLAIRQDLSRTSKCLILFPAIRIYVRKDILCCSKEHIAFYLEKEERSHRQWLSLHLHTSLRICQSRKSATALKHILRLVYVIKVLLIKLLLIHCTHTYYSCNASANRILTHYLTHHLLASHRDISITIRKLHTQPSARHSFHECVVATKPQCLFAHMDIAWHLSLSPLEYSCIYCCRSERPVDERPLPYWFPVGVILGKNWQYRP